MEEKIEKIFSYFGNIKNQPFYTSCISQIIEIYENNPESLKFILYNLNQLVFATTKEVRLRLKHRLIASSLISKLNRIYSQRVSEFMADKLNFELESFQLDTQAKGEEMEVTSKWQELDLFNLIENERLLYSTRGTEIHSANDLDEQNNKDVFGSFIEMDHATMLNIQNAFKDVALRNDAAEEAIKNEALKYKIKAQKISKKSQEQIDSIELTISNPFNLMYEICVNNLLHTEWELRHLAVLILKELLLHSDYLGFHHTFKLNSKQNRQDRFKTISNITKDSLQAHLANIPKRRDLIDDIIYKNICLLALDRFADYQTDESVILIRMISAEILSICFRTLENKRQLNLIKMIKKVFEKETPFCKQNKKMTWQVKHSFLYFLNVLLKDDSSFSKMICLQLEEPFIMMLASDQVDEIIVCICRIIEHFIGGKFFTPDKIDRMNRQVWSIVENLDDLSISAKDTLSLLSKLFPYFKLNQANCIDRLKKFFISKISEVRSELYMLTGLLYGRKKAIDDGKIVEKNLVQLLQGALIEYQSENFQRIRQVMPEIMPYILKFKNVRKIIEFINTCVTPHQYTEQIINQKFLMGVDKEKSEYMSNQYLYIMEPENLHAPTNAYIDKRIWKISIVLVDCFRHSPQGLEQLLKGIEKNNQRNHRGKLLIFLLLNKLLHKYRKQLKLFEEYKQQANKLLAFDFNQFTDNEIQKIYLPELQKQFNSILQNQGYKAEEQSQAALGAVRQIAEAFKKNDQACLKNGVQIAKKISVYYAQPLNPVLLGDLEMILRILNNIMKIQRQLMKNIKILALEYLIQCNESNEVQNLNVVIKCIMDAIKEDSYNFISQSTAEAASGLSLRLVKSKRAVYSKFNNNLCINVSTNYQLTEINLKQRGDKIKLQGTYMGGMCKYIQIMGEKCDEFLKDSWKYYLQEAQGKTQGKQLAEEYNRLLTLLTGTIISLLKIDNNKIDGQQHFIHKLTNKITQILKKNTEGQLRESIRLKIKVILEKIVKHLSTNYSHISNVFFEWFLEEMEKENIVVYQVLQHVSQQNIVQIAPISSLFILRIIKSITKVHLHDVAMNSLSNLIVGVYTNIAKNKFSQKLQKISQEGIEFIKNFKDTSNFNYPLRVNYHKDIVLRSYQMEGITWLGFLTRYNLSGALCDDMGLGKTLQTLTVVENQYKKMIDTGSGEGYLHSLIVCPNTLMQHWAFQYRKYFMDPVCEILVIDNKKKFGEVAKKLKENKPILFITGYSIIQKNQSLFQGVNLKFLILDQGHLIKNVKTLKFKSVKSLKGLHRFILTGTPIQNRLIELWGLFDFLMPGYLYTEDLFKKHYEKLFEVNLTTFKEDELLFSDDQRKTLEKLHYKVMPFIMRRMKSEVLKQLPEKIINDYYCTLSECQVKHYEDLQERIRIQTETKTLTPLKNLHDMINIVNHPYLASLVSQTNWEDSGKFVALGELIDTLGFEGEKSITQNKVIIFAREKATIDLIEKFFKDVYSTVRLLKLTSDVKQGERFTVAQTFNGDSDIKVLLVTKAIGGVGLNLSAANFVIMFDSDFNPTVDIQAIDRAHRIGQKRVLNVYRLITKDTLQEKIMGIQQFKINLANSIVNIDNSSIKNIKESKLPDLLESVRDLRKESKEEDPVAKSMYGALIAQMEKNAIETNQFMKRY